MRKVTASGKSPAAPAFEGHHRQGSAAARYHQVQAHQVPSKLEPFKPFTLHQVALGVTNHERMPREIRLQGYDCGHSILCDLVRTLRPPKRPIATARFETKPADRRRRASEYSSTNAEGWRSRYHAFIMVLQLLLDDLTSGSESGRAF